MLVMGIIMTSDFVMSSNGKIVAIRNLALIDSNFPLIASATSGTLILCCLIRVLSMDSEIACSGRSGSMFSTPRITILTFSFLLWNQVLGSRLTVRNLFCFPLEYVLPKIDVKIHSTELLELISPVFVF